MDLPELFLRLTGALYLLVAIASGRRMLVATVADKMIATLSGRPDEPRDRQRRLFLGWAAILSGAGGAALAMLSIWALPLLFANAAVLAAWMWRTRRDVVPRDASQRRARARTDAGAVLGALMALFAAFGWQGGFLGPVDDHVANAVAASAAGGLAAWISSGLNWWPWAHACAGMGFAEEEDGEMTGRPRRCEIAPAFGRWPLRDPDTGLRFSHFTWLDSEIADRIEQWDDLFQEAFAPDEPGGRPVFVSADAEARYLRECGALASELETVFGRGNVRLSPGVFWRDTGGAPV